MPLSASRPRLRPSRRAHATARTCLTVLLLAVAAPVVCAFIPQTLPPIFGPATGLVAKWSMDALPDGRIPYWVNLDSTATIGPGAPPDEILKHIHNAFQTWENIPTARVKFRFMGLTTARNDFDGKNVVTFDPQGIDLTVSQPAAAVTWFASAAGLYGGRNGARIFASFPGEILDADIVFLPQFPGVYRVGDDSYPPSTDMDLPGVLTHEVGHLLGLDHTNAGNDAALNVNASLRGGFTFRNLSTDDVIGISAMYPAPGFLESRGSIGGTVRRGDGSLVSGAHVVAIDAQTGVIVTSTISGVTETNADGTLKRFAVGTGEYRLVGLPPGTYRIYAEPLDGPGIGAASGVFLSADLTHHVMDVNFTPGFSIGTVSVGAMDLIQGVDITVAPRPSAAPNLKNILFVSEGPGLPFSSPGLARPGSTPIVSVPAGINLQVGSGLAPGTRFDFAGSDITIQQVMSRPGSDILLYLDISPTAAFGPRLLQITTADGAKFMSGALILVPPAPVIRSVSTSSTNGIVTAVIDGENFASPSRPVVLFNGAMSTSLTVSSATQLQATVPPRISGAVDVRVITLSGLARAAATLP